MASKMIKKALGFPLKVDGVLRLRETWRNVEKALVLERFGASKKVVQNTV